MKFKRGLIYASLIGITAFTVIIGIKEGFLHFEKITIITSGLLVLIGILSLVINTGSEAAKGWSIPWIMESINKFTLIQCITIGGMALLLAYSSRIQIDTKDSIWIVSMLIILIILFVFQIMIYTKKRNHVIKFADKVLEIFLAGKVCKINERRQRELIEALIEVDFKPRSLTNSLEGNKKREKREIFCEIISTLTQNPGDSITERDLLIPSDVSKLTYLQKQIKGIEDIVEYRNFCQRLYIALSMISIIVFIIAMISMAGVQIFKPF